MLSIIIIIAISIAFTVCLVFAAVYTASTVDENCEHSADIQDGPGNREP